jgi:hypothetical protein
MMIGQWATGRVPVLIGRGLRRAAALILIVSATSAVAAGLISQSLGDLERYLKAASGLVLQIATGLEGAKFDSLQPAERETAQRQLQTLSDGLGEIFLSQTSLVHNLDFYVTIAKDPAKTPAERDSFWNAMVLGPAQAVYRSVSEVKQFVTVGERLFGVTLSDADRLALGDNLRARGIVLRTFERMPPPTTPEDVLQLEGLTSHYKVLIENLRVLRLAVDGALRRIKGA